MKNNTAFVIIISLFVFFAGGCSERAKQVEQNNEKPGLPAQVEIIKDKTAAVADENKKALVTFVELGSVNCIPCKMMQPVMKEIEKDYKSKVKVIFYDVWTAEGKPFAEKYAIKLIPTQVFLDKEGKEFFRHEGFFSKEDIAEVLKKQGVTK